MLHSPQSRIFLAIEPVDFGWMRRAGYTNIAAACRPFAAQPVLALALIGIQLEN
jgi:hypothetical protein